MMMVVSWRTLVGRLLLLLMLIGRLLLLLVVGNNAEDDGIQTDDSPVDAQIGRWVVDDYQRKQGVILVAAGAACGKDLTDG